MLAPFYFFRNCSFICRYSCYFFYRESSCLEKRVCFIPSAKYWCFEFFTIGIFIGQGDKVSSAQGNIVTPSSTTSPWQLPFTVNLSQLDYVDVITIDAGVTTSSA
jgi:hypothetical protein